MASSACMASASLSIISPRCLKVSICCTRVIACFEYLIVLTKKCPAGYAGLREAGGICRCKNTTFSPSRKHFDEKNLFFPVSNPFFRTFAPSNKNTPMPYKTNRFPTEKTQKTPIKFGGFGNLFKHTHTHTHSINPSVRFFARQFTAFFAYRQGKPVCFGCARRDASSRRDGTTLTLDKRSAVGGDTNRQTT